MYQTSFFHHVLSNLFHIMSKCVSVEICNFITIFSFFNVWEEWNIQAESWDVFLALCVDSAIHALVWNRNKNYFISVNRRHRIRRLQIDIYNVNINIYICQTSVHNVLSVFSILSRSTTPVLWGISFKLCKVFCCFK